MVAGLVIKKSSWMGEVGVGVYCGLCLERLWEAWQLEIGGRKARVHWSVAASWIFSLLIKRYFISWHRKNEIIFRVNT